MMKHISIIFTLFIFFISRLHAEDSIKVQAGWNNIGAISTRTISQITSVPPGIVTSFYFGYTPTGYTATDTLTEGKGYWVKTSQAGILKWGTVSSAPCAGTPTVSYGEKIYTTVEIGTQCWMKENLDVGTMIQGTDSSRNNGIIEKYCYDNNASNCETYGGLYHWNEAMQYVTTRGAQGICPTGWHIPTNGELAMLGDIVNGDANSLKAVGQGTGFGAGTDAIGFSALLSGYLHDETFFSLSYNTSLWSSSQYDTMNYNFIFLRYDNSRIRFDVQYLLFGFSVRCLKD